MEGEFGLFSLVRRRERGDLMEVYKIMRGTDRANELSLISRVGESRTRGNRERINGNLQSNYF